MVKSFLFYINKCKITSIYIVLVLIQINKIHKVISIGYQLTINKNDIGSYIHLYIHIYSYFMT